jgi:hypothetical protein
VALYGKVGGIGHGKTLRAVVHAREIASLRAKRRRCAIASNIRVVPPAGVPFVQLPMDGFSQALSDLIDDCVEAESGLVLLVDEVDTIWDAREWQEFSKQDRYRIKQSRKLGVDVIWTAQFADQVEKVVRNLTEEVELMRAWPYPSIARREADKRPLVIMGSRFRPGAVRDLMGEPNSDRRRGRSFYVYRRKWEAWYDTDELVVPLERKRRRAERTSTYVAMLAGDGDELEAVGLGVS